MKTLEQHNREADARRESLKDALSKTGAACDICGAEVLFENPGTANMSDPPSFWVLCPKCDFRWLLRY